MIMGVREYDHEYVIDNNRLKYKDQDGLSDTITYGFKTIFANLFEFKRHRLTENAFNDAVEMALVIAEFSYAMLPSYFKSIIGVTGTYEEMSEFKKRHIR